MGPRAGQQAFTLRSLPGTPLLQPGKPFLASADGFSLHAGVAAGADDRKKVIQRSTSARKSRTSISTFMNRWSLASRPQEVRL